MRVLAMDAVHYPRSSKPGNPRPDWKCIRTRDPKWREIKTAILRLERDEWPYIWLHAEEPPKDDFSEDMFCVMGGRGEYALSLWHEGNDIRYHDPSRSEETVRIWESDQGAEACYHDLCNNLELVLKITKAFALTGELDPDVEWRAT